MKTKKIPVLIMLSCFLTAIEVNAQDGGLDTTFHADGMVVTPIGSIQDQGNSVAIQPDGKIVVAGYTHNGSDLDFAVTRYNTNGTLDLTFNSSGVVTVDMNSLDNEGYAVAIQNDGKILLAGASHSGSNMDFAIIRLLPNGVLDNSFDMDGKVMTDVGGSTDIAYCIAIQPDNKIIIGGSAYNGSNEDFAMVRYHTNGLLDSGFDSDGKVLLDFSMSTETATSMALQPDGKILLAGWTGNYPSGDFAIARFHANGLPDNSFDGDGKLTKDIQSTNDEAMAMTIQPDGKILVAGSSGAVFQQPYCSIIRINSTGVLDLSFNGTGKATFDLISGQTEGAKSLAVQSDGKIVIGGAASNGVNGNFALIRLTQNGILDNTFDSNGWLITDFGGADDVSYAMDIQDDNQIILAGMSGFKFAAARYHVITICDLVATVAVSDFEMQANLPGVNYQWLNCDNGFAEIAGATSQTFNPVLDGNYAVAVEQVGCMDTSACTPVWGLGTPDFTGISEIDVFPNPSTGIFTLLMNNSPDEPVLVEIFNPGGRLVFTEQVSENQVQLNLDEFANGIYTLHVTAGDQTFVDKLVKN